jgi:hypothetical protein
MLMEGRFQDGFSRLKLPPAGITQRNRRVSKLKEQRDCLRGRRSGDEKGLTRDSNNDLTRPKNWAKESNVKHAKINREIRHCWVLKRKATRYAGPAPLTSIPVLGS